MSCRVLFADDDPTAHLLVRAALGGPDFELTLVDNGVDALAAFTESFFDVVLLDVEMPGQNGLEVCSAIRSTYGPGLPIVLVTGRNDAAFLEQACQLSAEHLAKPVNWASLGGLLRSLLGTDGR